MSTNGNSMVMKNVWTIETFKSREFKCRMSGKFEANKLHTIANHYW